MLCSLWSLRALKHFLPLLMDFYSTFPSWCTFIAPRSHFAAVMSALVILCSLSYEDRYLNMNVAQEHLIFKVMLSLCVCVVRVYHSLYRIRPVPVLHHWAHLDSKYLLWFWVRFKGYESEVVLNAFGNLCLGTRLYFQGHANISNLPQGSHCTESNWFQKSYLLKTKTNIHKIVFRYLKPTISK